MHQSRLWIWRVAAGILAIALQPAIPSHAVTFGQTEVNQSKFVAIAVPRASGYYTLLVLEQRSDQKPCWRESGSNPTRVEPLLLNFNFTGICGRSMDSNGYSIRAAGQDLGLKYQLSLQKQKNDVLLLGLPDRAGSPSSKSIQLGRTRGIRSGFLKINLSPGWRFTKRTYSGKALGHIYFSRDTAPAYQIASSRVEKSAKTPKRVVSAPNRPAAASASERRSSRSSYVVMVMASSAAQQAKVRAQQPSAFPTSHQGQSVMQVGTFSDRAKAESLKIALTRQGFKVLMIARSRALSRLNNAIATANQTFASSVALNSNFTRIDVPRRKVPVGYVRGSRETYAAGYSPTQRLMLPPPPPPPPTYR
jgi:N-acetylmuramoyl-L-alanine amidase